MGSLRKQGGAWREVNRRCRKVNGQWRQVKEKYVKVGGVWRLADNFFCAAPYILSPDNYVGTYKAGLLDDGQIGVEVHGQVGSLNQTQRIGIKVGGIPENTAVTIIVDYQTSLTSSTMLAVRSSGVLQANNFDNVTDYTMSWSMWPSSETDIAIDISNTGYVDAKLVIKRMSINGVWVL